MAKVIISKAAADALWDACIHKFYPIPSYLVPMTEDFLEQLCDWSTQSSFVVDEELLSYYQKKEQQEKNMQELADIAQELHMGYELDSPQKEFQGPVGKKPSTFDEVKRPAHYNLNEHGIEAIDAIEASMSVEEFKGYLKGNALKYLWRYRYKGNPVTDLKKAEDYLQRLIKRVEKTTDASRNDS